jgi:hypothetical protein
MEPMKVIPVTCGSCAVSLKIKIPPGRRIPAELKCPKCGAVTAVTENGSPELTASPAAPPPEVPRLAVPEPPPPAPETDVGADFPVPAGDVRPSAAPDGTVPESSVSPEASAPPFQTVSPTVPPVEAVPDVVAARIEELDQRVHLLELRAAELERRLQTTAARSLALEGKAGQLDAVLLALASECRNDLASAEKKVESLKRLLASLPSGAKSAAAGTGVRT